MFQPFFSSGSIRASRKTHVGPSRSNLGGQDPSIGSWDSIEVTTASSWREGYQTGTDSEAWYLRWFSCVLVSFWVCFLLNFLQNMSVIGTSYKIASCHLRRSIPSSKEEVHQLTLSCRGINQWCSWRLSGPRDFQFFKMRLKRESKPTSQT